MTAKQLAKFLIEANVDPIIKVFTDRLMLRMFQTPSLMASLLDVNITEKEGNNVIQLDFKQLPDEIVYQLRRVIGPSTTRLLKFEHEGICHTGVEVSISPEELEAARQQHLAA